MSNIHYLTGQRVTPAQHANRLGLATCLAIDAGCMAASGLAGVFAVAMAWLVLKVGGVI